MATIEIHSSVLCLATEAPIDDNGQEKKGEQKNFYAGLPNWAGYGSGIGIGIGYDIGASGHSPKQLQQLMSSAGIEQWVIDALIPYCYQTYKAANKTQTAEARAIVDYLIFDKKIRLSQQQCLDFLSVIKVQHNLGVERYFSKSHNSMHDAVKEVFVKVHFGAPANCKYISELYDAKFSKTVSAIDQCNLCKEAMDTLLAKYGKNGVYYQQYRSFKAFMDSIIEELRKGNTIKIDHSPTTVEKILQNDTCKFVAATTNEVELARFDIGLKKAIRENDQETIDWCRYKISDRKKNPFTSEQISSKIEKTLEIQGVKSTVLNSQDLKNAKEIVRYDPFMVEVQEQLKAAGYYTSSIDGIFGSGTKAALEQYQKAKGLKVSGQFDQMTINSFFGKDYLPSNSSKNNTTSADWWSTIFNFVQDKKEEQPEDLDDTSIFDWIKTQAQDLWNDFDRDPETDSPSFWESLQQATEQIFGLKPKEDKKTGLNAGILKAALKGSGKINSSVGRSGKNIKADVVIVRALLSAQGYHDKSVWSKFKEHAKTLSKVDNQLFLAIEKFQKEKVGLANPDGRIDPGGMSLRVLNGGKGYSNPPQHETVENTEVSSKLSASVGAGGVNKRPDVRLIQKLLNEKDQAGLVVDGLYGAATKRAIKNFQQKQFGWADGRVDVGGSSWKALSGSNSEAPPFSGEEEEETPDFKPTALDASVFPCFN